VTELQGSPTFTDLEETKADTQGSSVQAAVDRAREAEKAERATPAPQKRGRGRPKGSRTRRPVPASEPAEPEAEEEPPSPTELRGVGVMWGVVWRILARTTGRVRPLEKSEELELAEASVPMMRKYAPALDRWMVEINFGVAILGVIMETAIVPTPPAPPATAPPPETTPTS
jgi:hypothetical protein